jgi:branched-chain amino acid transport system permease protein
MAGPRIVQRGSLLHRAAQFALFGVVGLFFLRAGTAWSRTDLAMLTDAIILAIVATGLNLLTGYTGQISIGHSAFFGLGGYTTAMLMDKRDWSAGWTFPIVIVLCFLVGVIVGLPALRLRGIYLALVTLGLAVAFPALLNYKELTDFTGGAVGIKNLAYLPPEWTPFDGRADLHKWNFWLAVTVFLVCALIASNLLRSRMGRAMVAVRDNETAAAVMGVDRAIVKTVVFGLSASMAGIAGSLFALKLTLVEPSIGLFTILGAITFLVIVVIGGAASTWGPLVGALVYIYVSDWARDVGEKRDIAGLSGVLFGALLILFARFAPFGVVGAIKLVRSKFVVVVPRPPTRAAAPGTPADAATTLPDEVSTDDVVIARSDPSTSTA